MNDQRQDSDEYDAFISYRHGCAEDLVANLQKWLERWATPWHGRRRLWIFRDTTNMAAHHDLRGAVMDALAASRWLVLMASRPAGDSDWMETEIAWWLSEKPPERVIVVLLERGSWHSDGVPFRDADGFALLPASARKLFRNEPLWVDFAKLRTREVLTLSDPVVRDAVASIAAPLLNQPKDTLLDEHATLQRRIRRQRFAAAVGGTLAVVLAVVGGIWAITQTGEADRQRATAVTRRLVAQSQDELADDPQHALRLALAARSLDPGPATASNLTELITRTRFAGVVTGGGDRTDAVAFAPDGRWLAAAGDDEYVRIWDLTARSRPQRVGQPVNAQRGRINAIAFASDGRLFATGSDDGSIVLWKIVGVDSVEQVSDRVPAHTASTAALAFTTDGRRVITGGSDGVIALWDITDPRRPLVSDKSLRVGGRVVSLAISSDGRTLAAGDSSGYTTLWNLDNGPTVTPLTNLFSGSVDDVSYLRFSPDGGTLVVSTRQRTFAWDVTDGSHPTPRPSALIDAAPGLRTALFSPDLTTALESSSQTGLVLSAIRGDRSDVDRTPLKARGVVGWPAAFSPDGSLVATGGQDGRLFLWNVHNVVQPRAISTPIQIRGVGEAPLSVDPRGRSLACPDNDGTLALWDISAVSTPTMTARLNVEGTWISSVAFSPTRPLLAVGTVDGRILLWDISDLRHPTIVNDQLRTFRHPAPAGRIILGAVTSLSFAPSGDLLSAAGLSTVGYVFDVADPAHPRDVVPLTREPMTTGVAEFAGSTLVTVDNQPHLWGSISGPRPQRLADLPEGDGVTALALSPRGTTLITGGGDGTAHVWDVSNPKRPRRIGGVFTVNTNSISAIAFSADERWIATSSRTSEIEVWNVEDRSRPWAVGLRLRIGSEFTAVRLLRDAATLVTADSSGTTTLWDLTAVAQLRTELVGRACGYANGSLDRSDWPRLVPGTPYADACRS